MEHFNGNVQKYCNQMLDTILPDRNENIVVPMKYSKYYGKIVGLYCAMCVLTN